MPTIQLSPMMQNRVAEWKRLGHSINLKLLSECAYYPRGGCQNCEWNSPNPDCKWSHILIDTRIDTSGLNIKIKMKKRERSDMEKLLTLLPPEARKEIEKLFQRGR